MVNFQKQLSEGKFALLSCEELLGFANKTLNITDEEEFLKVQLEEGIQSGIQSGIRSFPKAPVTLVKLMISLFQAAKQIKERFVKPVVSFL